MQVSFEYFGFACCSFCDEVNSFMKIRILHHSQTSKHEASASASIKSYSESYYFIPVTKHLSTKSSSFSSIDTHMFRPILSTVNSRLRSIKSNSGLSCLRYFATEGKMTGRVKVNVILVLAMIFTSLIA